MFQTPTTAPNLLLHISYMDCRVKEAEIRRALEPVTGIALLDFQLSARALNSGLHDDPTLWMAVFANMGTSLLVIANSLRLLRLRR